MTRNVLFPPIILSPEKFEGSDIKILFANKYSNLILHAVEMCDNVPVK